MKHLLLFFAVIFAFNSTKAQTSAAPSKETLEERCIREGFKVEATPQPEHVWLIELDKQGYSNEDAIKEVERRKRAQSKNITYNLNSMREQYEHYLRTPVGKRIPRPRV